MPVLHLHNRMTSDALVIPGIFIDSYLPSARGDDVKVFLFLLRAVSRPDTEVSLASLSDALETSERDILRSLSYWEKTGLIRLSFNSDHVLDGVSFLDINDRTKNRETRQETVTPDEKRTEKQPEPDQKPEQKKRVPRDLTPQEAASLDQDFDFNALIFMAEQCFGTLNPTDASRLGYWFINFDRSTAVLEALLEYCAAQCQPGRANTRYFDTVAAGWFSEGVTSAEQAREYSQFRNTLVYGVMKAFGLKNKRDPNQAELDLIRKWSKDYGFSNEMIFLACTRTAAQTNRKQFAYADSILTAWHDQKITTPTQVEEADLEYKKRTAASRRPVEISKSARQFHNFEERNTDYEALILDQYRNQNS